MKTPLGTLRVGDKLRNTMGLWHVRGFVDGRVVLRQWWRKHGGYWNYTIAERFELTPSYWSKA